MIGVIGGMGAFATAKFYQMLISARQLKTEQEIPDILLYSKSSIPDRTAFITGDSIVSPAEELINAARFLQYAGAEVIAMPCVTAHFFYNEIFDAVSIPVCNLVEIIWQDVQHTKEKIGLLATDGTLAAQLFPVQPGRDIILPDEENQQELMRIIYEIKKGECKQPNTYVYRDILHELEMHLLSKGAEVIILGCTELSLIAEQGRRDRIDPLECLADATLRMNDIIVAKGREKNNEKSTGILGEHS